MVKDSIGIMEQGACTGTAAVPIHYYDVDRMQERTIESCQRSEERRVGKEC